MCEKNPTGAVVSANEKKKTAAESKMEVRKGTYDKKLKSEREEKDEKQEKMKNGRERIRRRKRGKTKGENEDPNKRFLKG